VQSCFAQLLISWDNATVQCFWMRKKICYFLLDE
jgi:hypothetical protein